MKDKTLYIDLQLGLGDLIILNGLIRYKAKYQFVVIPAHPHNIESAYQMFEGNKNIGVVSKQYFDVVMPQEVEDGHEVLHLGDSGKDFRLYPDFASGMYSQARLGYELSYEEFKMPKYENSWKFSEPYLIYQDDKKREYYCNADYYDFSDDMDWIATWDFRDRPIGAWVEALGKAKEIHVLDSAFLHLCDRIPTIGKLFLHRAGRPYQKFDEVKLKKSNWEIIR